MKFRFTLVRYIAKETNWEPMFALRNEQQNLRTRDNGTVMTFRTYYEVVQWAMQEKTIDVELVWEGTAF